MIREGATEGLSIGSPYRFVLASGDVVEGEAAIVLPPTDFAGTAASHGDALWRFGYEVIAGKAELHLWFSAWGRSEEEMKALEARWASMLRASG